ncbi:MAG: insulinase family protein [Alphaproteobacteria bacterium]|nr:insulinase family protein [Alphaproteobacteria bacterium]
MRWRPARQLGLFVCVAAALALASCSQSTPRLQSTQSLDPARPEYAYWPHEASDLKPDPAIRYGVLANGMRYAIMRNAQPAGTVSLKIRIASGSLQESDQQRGLAHFMEHMAFNGSKNVPEGEYVKLLQRKGLAFGAHTNAYTSTNETVYMLELPKNDSDLIDTGLMLFREIGDRLTLDPAAIEREKGVVLSELRTRNTPEYRTFEARWGLWYDGQRQAARLPIGTVETIKGADHALLADYYARFYRPERTLVIATGDFDPADIESKIKARFADWPAAKAVSPDPDLGTVKQRSLTVASRVEPNLPEDITLSWFKGPDDAVDSTAERRANALRNVAFEVVNRRLGRIARSANAPFVSASLGYSTTRGTSRSASLSISARPGQWRTAMAAAEQELRRALVHGFHQSEIDREVKSWRAGYEDSVAKAGTRRTPDLASQIASEFESRGVFTHPSVDLEIFNATVPALTADATLAALRDAVTGQGPIVFVSSGVPITGGDTAIAAAYEQSFQTAVAAPQVPEAKQFPYTSFGSPGAVVEKREAADLGISMLRFANGVRLNVKQTDFEKDTIYVTVRFAGGYIHMPRNKIGLNWALPFGFTEGGLKQLTTEELEESLTGRIVSTDLDLDEEAFEFGGRTNARDLELQMQLMAAFATDPAYRSNGFERLQGAAENFIKQYTSSPGRVLSRELPSLLRSGDTRWAFPTLSQMQALRIADVRSTLAPALSTAPIEISIVGDVTVDAAVNAIAGTFGAFNARAGKLAERPDARAVHFPLAARKQSFTHEGKPDQAVAYVAWPAPDFYSSPRRARTVSLLREMLKVRLTDEFREAQGATYSPSTSSWHSGALPDFGYISANAETKPELVDGFYRTLDKIVAEIRSGNFTDDLIARARTPIVKSIEKDRRANAFWLSAIEDIQTEPRSLEGIRTQLSDVESITKDELVAVAQKYLDNKRRVEIRILPVKQSALSLPPNAGKRAEMAPKQPVRERELALAYQHH